MPFCRDNDKVLITHSSDDGRNWTQPIDITGDVKEPDWTWYATGPVSGIQLRRPPYRGRLVIPVIIVWVAPKTPGTTPAAPTPSIPMTMGKAGN